jgi:hypothetical protein
MHATDVDKSDTSLTYSVQGHDTNYFYMNSKTGDLYLIKTLNREAADGSKRIWLINAVANDGKHDGFAIVKFNVQDINDNVPIFSESSLKGFSIKENSPIGKFFFCICSIHRFHGRPPSLPRGENAFSSSAFRCIPG